MGTRIYVTPQLRNPEFASPARSAGLERLAALAAVQEQPPELTAENAEGVIAVIADSAPFRDSFYAAAGELRLVARWGVGFDQVNVAAATRHGVLITITPVHVDTVAEYTIAQWLATMKRTYTLNRNAHRGATEVLRGYDAQGSTLGLLGFGRIGQEVARRARPLLGAAGRLLVYDVRPDVAELAARFEAAAVAQPEDLFRECDTVSLHVSGDATVVGRELLTLMRPHASLLNPSRGNLVDDAAVHEAIEQVELADGLGFDYVWRTSTTSSRNIRTPPRPRSSSRPARATPGRSASATPSSYRRRPTTIRPVSPNGSPRST